MVERSVDYVKDNGLKGYTFPSAAAENRHLVEWGEPGPRRGLEPQSFGIRSANYTPLVSVMRSAGIPASGESLGRCWRGFAAGEAAVESMLMGGCVEYEVAPGPRRGSS